MTHGFYFKHRDPWDLYPHPYEIGNRFFFNAKLERNFFCNKIRSIPQTEYKPFFFFHQQLYLQQHPDQQQQFLKHALDTVQHRIEHYRAKDIYNGAEATLSNLERLEAFKSVLIELDEWNLQKSLEILLVEKEIELASCRQEITELKEKIKQASVYDADSKIRLNKDSLPTLIDLIQQIQKLTLPDGRKFTMFQSQSPWYKMIAKYFQNGEKEIPLDTLRNYLQTTKVTKNIKGTEVKKEDKLFFIKPKNTIVP